MIGANSNQQLEIIDLLVDGPVSLAALYGSLDRYYSTTNKTLTVDGLWDLVRRAEEAGWLKVTLMLASGGFGEASDIYRARALSQYQEWLPQASPDELSVDEVGLWLEVRPEGRRAWEKWVEIQESAATWTLDQDSHTGTITIHAEEMRTAAEALQNWLQINPAIEVLNDNRTEEPVREFRLHDGKVVHGGVRLRVRYREGRVDP
mgnify:CR=1 FL=1